MTNSAFVVSSVEKSPAGSFNHPINIAHCTCLMKEHFQTTNGRIYRIWFDGCSNSYNESHSWSYSSQEERDADYDRILNAFTATTLNS